MKKYVCTKALTKQEGPNVSWDAPEYMFFFNRQLIQINGLPFLFCQCFSAGKSLSEALILASTNPQYDKRLFIELPVQYLKIPSSEHVVYINCSECQNKNQFVFTTCSLHVLSLQFSCNELVIQ